MSSEFKLYAIEGESQNGDMIRYVMSSIHVARLVQEAIDKGASQIIVREIPKENAEKLIRRSLAIASGKGRR